MRFEMTMRSGNAAFAEDGEVVRILREMADKIEATHATSGLLHDLNGNRVGEWYREDGLEEDEEG